MASLSLIAYAPDLSEPVYQRLLYAISEGQRRHASVKTTLAHRRERASARSSMFLELTILQLLRSDVGKTLRTKEE